MREPDWEHIREVIADDLAGSYGIPRQYMTDQTRSVCDHEALVRTERLQVRYRRSKRLRMATWVFLGGLTVTSLWVLSGST